MFNALFEALKAKLRAIDPKLIATGVTFLLTLAITKILPNIGITLGLDNELVPGYITVGQAIALSAAAAAGWWKANAATLLRTVHESGNAIPPDSSVTRV